MSIFFTKYQKGVSLLEILVTTLILGIGLLGVASLQVASVTSNQEGFFHSQATSIAEDLASRMRSGKAAEMVPWNPMNHAVFLANYISNVPYGCAPPPALAPALCRNNSGAAPHLDCSDGVNDLADLSSFDKWDLCEIAQVTLPDGKVRMLNSANMRVSIVVDWDASKARSDLGQKTNVNSNCDAIIGDNTRNCIVMELIP